jgi:hypothetical protein
VQLGLPTRLPSCYPNFLPRASFDTWKSLSHTLEWDCPWVAPLELATLPLLSYISFPTTGFDERAPLQKFACSSPFRGAVLANSYCV